MLLLDGLRKSPFRERRQAEFARRLRRPWTLENTVREIFRDQVVGRSRAQLSLHRHVGRIAVANLPVDGQWVLEDLYDALAERCLTCVLYQVWDELDRELQRGRQ